MALQCLYICSSVTWHLWHLSLIDLFYFICNCNCNFAKKTTSCQNITNDGSNESTTVWRNTLFIQTVHKIGFRDPNFLGIASSFTESRTKEEVLCPPLAETMLTQTPFLQRTNRNLRKRKNQALILRLWRPKHLCNVGRNTIKYLVFVKQREKQECE